MKRNILLLIIVSLSMTARCQVVTDTLNIDSTKETTIFKQDKLPVDSVFIRIPDGTNNNNITIASDPVKDARLQTVAKFKLKPKVDIPLTVVTVGWSLYALSKIYNKDPSTLAEIEALRIPDINSFDRSGASVYHESADKTGDAFFYGSMPLPLILLVDKNVRRELGKVSFLFLEAMGITGFLYTGAVYFNDRHRPYTYNSEVDMDKRLRGGGKNSFFAGHVALVGTSTFFCASVYDQYHPRSPLKWVFYTAAAAATVTTGIMRYQGGQHFKSDIILGTLIGTASGLLVPRLHRVKENNRLTFLPLAGELNGFVLQYHLN